MDPLFTLRNCSRKRPRGCSAGRCSRGSTCSELRGQGCCGATSCWCWPPAASRWYSSRVRAIRTSRRARYTARPGAILQQPCCRRAACRCERGGAKRSTSRVVVLSARDGSEVASAPTPPVFFVYYSPADDVVTFLHAEPNLKAGSPTLVLGALDDERQGVVCCAGRAAVLRAVRRTRQAAHSQRLPLRDHVHRRPPAEGDGGGTPASAAEEAVHEARQLPRAVPLGRSRRPCRLYRGGWGARCD